jgi:leucyl-tRNA synthetase
MILGTSAFFVYRLEGTNSFVSTKTKSDRMYNLIHADVSMVNSSDELDVEKFKGWREDYSAGIHFGRKRKNIL